LFSCAACGAAAKCDDLQDVCATTPINASTAQHWLLTSVRTAVCLARLLTLWFCVPRRPAAPVTLGTLCDIDFTFLLPNIKKPHFSSALYACLPDFYSLVDVYLDAVLQPLQ
jgi:hypothetical protein